MSFYNTGIIIILFVMPDILKIMVHISLNIISEGKATTQSLFETQCTAKMQGETSGGTAR